MLKDKLLWYVLKVNDYVTPEYIEIIKENDEYDFVTTAHNNIGQDLRNDLGLWDKQSHCYLLFKEFGIWHADDMSGVLLTSYHRLLNKQDIDFTTQFEEYQQYWEMSL